MPERDFVQMLTRQRDALAELPHSSRSSGFTTWNHTTRSILTRALGEKHHVTEAFLKLSWTPSVYSYGGDNAEAFRSAFSGAAHRARGLLDAAIVEVQDIGTATDVADQVGYDEELWNHVAADVQNEEWGKVASQTAIFTEDRIRKWTGRPAEEVGERLMTAVFGDNGDYRLGLTAGEKNGWHRFAMGISMALRNVDAHRMQQRPDHRRYAMGVLGASSLLLTQLRFEHGNRFHDTSPAQQPEKS